MRKLLVLAALFSAPAAYAQYREPWKGAGAVPAQPASTAQAQPTPTSAIRAEAVAMVGLTVSDMDRSVEFYTKVLDFEKVSDNELAGREYEQLEGVFGARIRVVRLRL